MLNDPNLKDALGVLLDLAGESMLDEEDTSIKNYEPLLKQAQMQSASVKLIHEFYDTL